jgi:hypothetical protein
LHFAAVELGVRRRLGRHLDLWSVMMRNFKLALSGLSLLALSACVVAPYPRYAAYPAGYPAYDAEIAVAPVAPPPPYAEVRPAAPFVGALWIAGYWGWVGGRHEWVAGRWERPRPGYGWAPHRWVQSGGQWHLHGGGWVRQ